MRTSIVFFFIFFCSITLSAQYFDNSFGKEGKLSFDFPFILRKVITEPDGGFYTLSEHCCGSYNTINISKFNSDGKQIQDFGNNGVVTIDVEKKPSKNTAFESLICNKDYFLFYVNKDDEYHPRLYDKNGQFLYEVKLNIANKVEAKVMDLSNDDQVIYYEQGYIYIKEIFNKSKQRRTEVKKIELLGQYQGRVFNPGVWNISGSTLNLILSESGTEYYLERNIDLRKGRIKSERNFHLPSYPFRIYADDNLFIGKRKKSEYRFWSLDTYKQSYTKWGINSEPDFILPKGQRCVISDGKIVTLDSSTDKYTMKQYNYEGELITTFGEYGTLHFFDNEKCYNSIKTQENELLIFCTEIETKNTFLRKTSF